MVRLVCCDWLFISVASKLSYSCLGGLGNWGTKQNSFRFSDLFTFVFSHDFLDDISFPSVMLNQLQSGGA